MNKGKPRARQGKGNKSRYVIKVMKDERWQVTGEQEQGKPEAREGGTFPKVKVRKKHKSQNQRPKDVPGLFIAWCISINN